MASRILTRPVLIVTFLLFICGCAGNKVGTAVKYFEEGNTELDSKTLAEVDDEGITRYLESHPEYEKMGFNKQEWSERFIAAREIEKGYGEFQRERYSSNESAVIRKVIRTLDLDRWNTGWIEFRRDLPKKMNDCKLYLKYKKEKTIMPRLESAKNGKRWKEILDIHASYALEEINKYEPILNLAEIIGQAKDEWSQAQLIRTKLGGQFPDDCSEECDTLYKNYRLYLQYERAARDAPEIKTMLKDLSYSQSMVTYESCIFNRFVDLKKKARELYNTQPAEAVSELDRLRKRLGILRQAKDAATEAECIRSEFSMHVTFPYPEELTYKESAIDMAIRSVQSRIAEGERFSKRGRLLQPECTMVGQHIRGEETVHRGKVSKWQGAAAFPEPREKDLRPEDVYVLEVVVPDGYSLEYLTKGYDDLRQTGAESILFEQSPQEIDNELHFLSSQYGGGNFYLMVRNEKGDEIFKIRCVVYKKIF